MGFTVCYVYQGKTRVFELPDNYLTPHDAVCYALFDSPAERRERPSHWEGSYANIVEFAEQHGVTDVRWHQSLTHPHHQGLHP